MSPAPLLVAAVLTNATLTAAALPLLRRTNVVDKPNERSSHKHTTVRGLGFPLAIATTSTFALVGTLPASTFLLPSAILATVGFLDDVHGLPALPRLLSQVFAGLALAILFGTTSWIPLMMTCLLLVAYVNAVNFMDGLNGISGGHALVAAGHLTLLSATMSYWQGTAAGLALIGTTLAFLPYNFPRAKGFLGDSGSYFLGGWIGTIIAGLTHHGVELIWAIAPLIPYLTDTGITLLRRTVRGDSLTTPHRDHVYQRLADRNGRQTGVALSVTAMAALCSAGAWAIHTRPLFLIPWYALISSLYIASPRLIATRNA